MVAIRYPWLLADFAYSHHWRGEIVKHFSQKPSVLRMILLKGNIILEKGNLAEKGEEAGDYSKLFLRVLFY